MEYVYFVNRGLISLVKTMQDGRSVEIGVVGVEGVTNWHAFFGFDEAILDAIVQIPGTAFRISRDVLEEKLSEDCLLREAIQNYARFTCSQVAQTAGCNRLHSLEQRCCRWLLTAHDSARSDTFPVTHELLATMLGVQRAGVSIAANSLQKAGWIRYSRGNVSITDRSGLERSACECYSAMRSEIDELFHYERPAYAETPASSFGRAVGESW